MSVHKRKGSKTKTGIALALELSNDFPTSSSQNYFEDSDSDDSFIPSMVDFSNVSVPSQSILSDESFADMRSTRTATPRFMKKVG